MGVLDVILAPQVIAGVLIVAMLLMSIRSILFYTREATALRPRMAEIDRELYRLREGMGEKKKAVEELVHAVAPLKEKEEKLRVYYEDIRSIELEADRKAFAEAETEDTERRKRIQRKKMGFDGK
jgi:chromosome segregation ATPase